MKTTVQKFVWGGLALGAIVALSACLNADGGDDETGGTAGGGSTTTACDAFFAAEEERPDGYGSLAERVETELTNVNGVEATTDDLSAMRSTLFQIEVALTDASDTPEDVAELIGQIQAPYDEVDEYYATSATEEAPEPLVLDTQAALDAIEPLREACDAG
ncbi:hypothetical protein Bcav_0684 [Beutenbergia cavernae DSM 12333]|uniref:Lipoprotein n=2 Tax=Beutenbergia TaxID=84756 RepID=C5BYI7_BEUC1|nr:hypothetical protein Bcav_0684 [Beutenbergia cavernae DSM 12333]